MARQQDLTFLQTKQRNENVRRAIRGGRMSDQEIMEMFGVSRAVFDRLAGQVRMGFVA